MRDALANIRLAFVQIKGAGAPTAPWSTSRDPAPGIPPTSGRDRRRSGASGRWKRPTGASTRGRCGPDALRPQQRRLARPPGRPGGVRRCARPATTAARGRCRPAACPTARPAGEPGVLGHVAVADHLALGTERHEHGDDAPVAPSSLAH